METPYEITTLARIDRPDSPAPVSLEPVPQRRIVGYERYAGGLVPVYETVTPVQATPPRDLTPQPLLDPVAQRMVGAGLGGGALSAGLGWGIGQTLNGLTGIGSGALFWIALMILAAKCPSPRRTARTQITQHVTATGLFGRANTTINK